jgi:hypothetical protein
MSRHVKWGQLGERVLYLTRGIVLLLVRGVLLGVSKSRWAHRDPEHVPCSPVLPYPCPALPGLASRVLSHKDATEGRGHVFPVQSDLPTLVLGRLVVVVIVLLSRIAPPQRLWGLLLHQGRRPPVLLDPLAMRHHRNGSCSCTTSTSLRPNLPSDGRLEPLDMTSGKTSKEYAWRRTRSRRWHEKPHGDGTQISRSHTCRPTFIGRKACCQKTGRSRVCQTT